VYCQAISVILVLFDWPSGGGHWGLSETEKPAKISTKTEKSEEKSLKTEKPPRIIIKTANS